MVRIETGMTVIDSKKILVGRCEWCQLPDLGIPAIKAKIDTGAKTSAIHAFDISTSVIHNKHYVNFKVHPIQGNTHIVKNCHALIKDKRYIMSSTGHKEWRYVIMTHLRLGGQWYEIELSLSNRDPLTFRMLLGREALNKRVIVDPSLSCCHGRHKRSAISQLYKVA